MECGVEAPGGAGGSGDPPLSHQCLVSQAVGLMRRMEVLLSLTCPRDPPRNMDESWGSEPLSRVLLKCPGLPSGNSSPPANWSFPTRLGVSEP